MRFHAVAHRVPAERAADRPDRGACLPRDRHAVGAEAGAEADRRLRAVTVVLDVLLARPDQLDRRADRLGSPRPPGRSSSFTARRPKPPPRIAVVDVDIAPARHRNLRRQRAAPRRGIACRARHRRALAAHARCSSAAPSSRGRDTEPHTVPRRFSVRRRTPRQRRRASARWRPGRRGRRDTPHGTARCRRARPRPRPR